MLVKSGKQWSSLPAPSLLQLNAFAPCSTDDEGELLALLAKPYVKVSSTSPAGVSSPAGVCWCGVDRCSGSGPLCVITCLERIVLL